MIKLKILNMENFLQTVNACGSNVILLHPDGKKENINRQKRTQEDLLQQYRQNKNCLRLSLSIQNPTDYMNIISYYLGDG